MSLPTHLSALPHSQVPFLPSSLLCSLHNMSTASCFHLQSPPVSSPPTCSKYAVWSHCLKFTPARPLLLSKMPPPYSTEMVLTEFSKDLRWLDFGFYHPPSVFNCYLACCMHMRLTILYLHCKLRNWDYLARYLCKAYDRSGSAAIQYLFVMLGIFCLFIKYFYFKSLLLLGIAGSNPSLKEYKIKSFCVFIQLIS